MPKFWWKIASDQRVGQKTKQASQLNFPATDSSDIPLRLPTRTNYNHMPFEFVLLTSTRLARDKTPRGSWPFAGHQNASGPNREEATKFNACVLWPASTAMNSNCASVSYVALTHSVYQQLITRAPIPARASTTSVASEHPELPPTEPPPTTADPTTTSAPTAPNSTLYHHTRDTTIRNEPSGHTGPDRRGHHRDTASSWHQTSSAYHGRYSSNREGRSRDHHHREGSSGYYNSGRDAYRSRW